MKDLFSLARNTDPATSHEAARGLSADAWQVAYEAAKKVCAVHRDATANEMGDRGQRMSTFSSETIRKRVGQLVDRGLLRLTGKVRRCTVTGKNAQTYEVI